MSSFQELEVIPMSDETAAADGQSFTERMRSMLREQLVDAAAKLAAERSWSDVTMSTVANEVGVSRQTLYREFGNKDALGEAMAIEVARSLIADASAQIDQHEDLVVGVEKAMATVLHRAEEDPLTRGVLMAARHEDELLPFLTTRTEGILQLAASILVQKVEPRVPEFTHEQLTAMVDTAVRIVVSHIVQPGGDPDEVAALIGWMLGRLMGMREPADLQV